MENDFSWIHLVYLGLAIICDIIANFFVKLSDGFKKKILAFIAIAFVLIAFTALSFAVDGIQLSVAYIVWGGLGLVGTALIGIFVFNEKIHFTGWLGMMLVISGVILMKFSS